ncbi:MAG: alpha-ketoacid dehydrogenase subunit beta [Acidimicrobiales bacterium]|nr:alpha-ketoacid dehydrogenase subunit beta [Acidimicrobiales bacterium]
MSDPGDTIDSTDEPADTGPHELIYLAAAGEAIMEEMARDDRVVLVGEDIELYGGGQAVPRFGRERVRSAPISEGGFTGMAIGAAITGLRPIVELTIASFVYLASDQIINQAAKTRYLFGGQASVPIVFRASMWHNGANAAQHSDRPYPMFMNVPGLKVVAPSTPWDAKGLMKAAIRDDDPVLVFEDNDLWMVKGEVPGVDEIVPLGEAAVRREGDDVTIVGISGAAHYATQAAETLAEDGIEATVIDPRTLVPLDLDTILASVRSTGRLVVADPANRTCSAASEIAARVVESAFDALRAPIVRVTTPDTHVPFCRDIERPLYPNPQNIAEAAARLVRGQQQAGS